VGGAVAAVEGDAAATMILVSIIPSNNHLNPRS